MQKKCLEGWTPESDLQPVRLATLLLLAVGSFALAVLCFRLLGNLTGGMSMLLWGGLCFSPPLGIVLWYADEQRRRARAATPVSPELEPALADGSEAELAETRLKISRDVA